MALVGLISDTHGHLDERAVGAFVEAQVTHIIHAGDICDPGILDELRVIAPVWAVLGNNDFDEYGPQVQRFARPVIEGVRFLVAHYPSDVRIGPHGCAGVVPGDPIPQVCVHGHTHVPELLTGREARPADMLICPGSVFRPRGGFPRCVGFVQVGDGRVRSARIVSLDGDEQFAWDCHSPAQQG